MWSRAFCGRGSQHYPPPFYSVKLFCGSAKGSEIMSFADFVREHPLPEPETIPNEETLAALSES
jgi:hypothetical protein